MTLEQTNNLAVRIRSILGEFNDDNNAVELLVRGLVEFKRTRLAGMGEPVDVGLVERLRKRAAEERQIAENNARVAELLSPELALLEARDGPNIYAARMAIDHRDSAKKDAAFAHDLDAAADMIEAAIKGVA
jgi:hypothetical protein